ncbi:MAG: hypothetical protein KGH98_01105 [Candidatus Micrarchaeota archaeon]|nr:hypothetical protein [Candidatus Micrarchaeota archaeon]
MKMFALPLMFIQFPPATFYLINALFAVATAMILVEYAFDFRHRRGFASLPIIASLITAAFVVVASGYYLTLAYLYLTISFAIIFSILPIYYMTRPNRFSLVLLFAIIQAVYTYNVYNGIWIAIMQIFGIGTFYGLLYRFYSEKRPRPSRSRKFKSVEISRDIVHIFLGIIIIPMFFLTGQVTAKYITVALVFLGYFYNNIGGFRFGSIQKMVKNLEREGTLHGYGALHLAIGVMFVLGFVHNFHMTLLGLIALFFADPMATIVGMNAKRIPLIYNRKKSLFGSLAYALVVFVGGYFLVGPFFAVLFAFALAFIESMDLPVDDNFSVAVAMIAIYLVAGSLGYIPLLSP